MIRSSHNVIFRLQSYNSLKNDFGKASRWKSQDDSVRMINLGPSVHTESQFSIHLEINLKIFFQILLRDRWDYKSIHIYPHTFFPAHVCLLFDSFISLQHPRGVNAAVAATTAAVSAVCSTRTWRRANALESLCFMANCFIIFDIFSVYGPPARPFCFIAVYCM